jgi:hypothetical protein
MRVALKRRDLRMSGPIIQIPIMPTAVIWRDICHGREIRTRVAPAAEPDLVVLTVTVTGTVVVDWSNVILVGLKLQLLCGGKPVHNDGVSCAIPVKPFCGVSVRTADPECPGAAMLICSVLIVIVKVCPTSTMVGEEVDPL